MDRYFDNAQFQLVKGQVGKLNDYLESLEDDEDNVMGRDPRTVVNNLKRKISSISRYWEDFERIFSEKFSKHHLELLKEYGAEIYENQAYWEKNRDRHEDVKGNELDYYTKEDDDPTENDRYLQVTVTYVEDENDLDGKGEYHLKMEDDLYDLDIEAVRSDIQGVLSVLYDLSSKFDFRKTLNMEKGQIDTNHVLQEAREVVGNPKSSNGSDPVFSDKVSMKS